MRKDLIQGYRAVQGSTPVETTKQRITAEAIVAAFKKLDRCGINFRNARPYCIGFFRGKRLYFCSDRAWNKGIEDFGTVLREAFAPKGYENTAIGGHDEWYVLAREVDELIRADEWNPYGKW